MKTRRLTTSTARLVLLAFGLSVVTATQLVASHGFLAALMTGAAPWPAVILVLAMVGVSTGAIVNAFTASMRPSPARTAGTVAACALAMTLGLAASNSVSMLPETFYFCLMLTGQAVYAYCMAILLTSCLNIAGKWALFPPRAAAAAVVIFGAAGFVGQSWIPLTTVTSALALARDLALVAVPGVLLAALALAPGARLDRKSARQSLRLRLPNASGSREARTVARAFQLMVGGLTFSAVLNLGLTFAESEGSTVALTLTAMSYGWIGAMYLCLHELAGLAGEQRQGTVTAKIAPTSARRFLGRHLSDQQTWAATVGLKTTNFSIDHDPGGILHAQLPASIMQIRDEEIQRCVNEVLGALQLHGYVAGHRIFGAVDPEMSIRPCIDALKMFACLYLDAGPLVERRIKGLTALLPIVDPALARVLRPTDVGSLIRRNVWFFHFDFSWLDQHIIHTPRNTRYDVRMASLSSRLRQSMMHQLEKTGGIGNFVWIGPEARDRLLQEAPSMKNVVEPFPVPLDPNAVRSGEDQDELLMFVIKFEQLIPRLQRYFDLDSMRKALLDFEPSQESIRLQNLLALQISKAKHAGDLREVLDAVTSVPWRGFREKDNALQLILAAHTQLASWSERDAKVQNSDGTSPGALVEQLLDAVRAVGYPSQILHDAQIHKLALRDIGTLKTVAANPHHARFPEAWLLMATTDYARYRPEARCELLVFLRDLPRQARLATLPLVQAKAVDALASLGKASQEGELPLLAAAVAATFHWFAKSAADPDVCSLLLDAHAFLASHLPQGLDLPAPATAAFGSYIDAMATDLGADHPKVIAVTSRWQVFRAASRADFGTAA